eukprot:gene4531-14697_t
MAVRTGKDSETGQGSSHGKGHRREILMMRYEALELVAWTDLKAESWEQRKLKRSLKFRNSINVSGIWGVLFVGLLAKEEYITEVFQVPPGGYRMGIFYGGHGQLLLCQVISITVTIAWSVAWMWSFYWLLNRLGILRISLGTEALGLDHAAMGEGNNAGLLSNDGPYKRSAGNRPQANVQMTMAQPQGTFSPHTHLPPGRMQDIPEESFDFEKLKQASSSDKDY